MSTIETRLTEDLKTAMKAGDKLRTQTIRNMRAALQTARQEVAKQKFDAARQKIEAEISDSAERETAIAALDINPREALDESAVISVLQKEIKRRHDAIALYREGGREELAAAEAAEAAIIEEYLPAMLSADDLRPQVAALIAELGLSGPASMGKLMPVLMERFKAQADGRILSQVARELLTG